MQRRPHRLTVPLIALAALATPVAAQDAPTIDYNGALDHARTTGRMVRQAQARGGDRTERGHAPRGQVAACARKEAFRRQYGAGNPKVRTLYRLCRGIGR